MIGTGDGQKISIKYPECYMKPSKCESLSIGVQTIDTILKFRDDREWKQFHNPKDLAISLLLEASELLECFQWSGADTEVLKKRSAMKDELSDVLIYAVLLADRLNIDIESAIEEKIEKNAQKYPVSKSYGRSEKYTEI